VDLQYAIQTHCACGLFIGGFALMWIGKNGMIYEKVLAKLEVLMSRRLARVLGAPAVAAAFALCVMPGFAQSARTKPESNSAAGASVIEQRSEGKELFRQHCASCHFADSTAQKIAAGMKGLYARSFSDGRKVTDVGLAKWIEVGGKDMPGFKETLKPEQVRALISYIKTL
jgi:mono/diheme cytochrome c family protein